MKYIIFTIFTTLFCSLILYSCANRGVPTGGPKDTIPPQLIKVIPADKSLNFDGDEVVLTFNEFIKLEDIANQLIITPRIKEEEPEEGQPKEEPIAYKLNKYTVTIAFKEPLDSSTTYTFNFQESIQDITESNPAEDLVIAFSTGDYIDSLFITGKVNDLLTNKPLEDAIVALYPSGDTLDIFNSKPQYFTKTDEEGLFRLENLKNASYKIYAFLDKNKNLTAQSDSEPYGFLPVKVDLDTSITDIFIPLIKRNVGEFRVQSTRPNGKYYEIKMNKYVDKHQLTVLENSDSLVSNRTDAEPEVIRIYNTITSDSVQTVFTAVDTIGQTITDTVYVQFPPTKRKSNPISHKMVPASKTPITEEFSATINFSKPIKTINLDSAFFYYDSLTVDTITIEDLSWNKFHDQLTLTKKLDKKLLEKPEVEEVPIADSLALLPAQEEQPVRGDSENEQTTASETGDNIKEEEQQKPKKSKFQKNENELMLFMASGTFISIEEDTIPEIKAVYTFLKSEDVGLIKGTVNTEKESYFIQLLNSRYEVIKEIKGAAQYTFNLIPPGEYILRILIDNNGDGVWYPGNILENVPPEDVYFYEGPVVIRANWERLLDEITF